MAQFGGNIAAVTFKQGTGTLQNYGYTYDEFSRLTQGVHSGGFNEKGIAYDPNGNITALTREKGTQPGVYTYTYDGNKLSVLKKGTVNYTYTYDANGNTTTDGLRGFTMSYNLLNLPKKVSKSTDYLEYVYDAKGGKLAKKKNNNFTQYYAGGVVYKADKTPEYVTTPEGLALNVSGTYNYQYNETDHLGNVRSVVDANSKTVVQTNDYYPFGLSHSIANLQKNKYLYNGKEYQDETLGGTLFGQLDYGARFYDPVIARWQVVDPLAAKYYNFSPYNYCFNSPLRFIDPDGKDGWDILEGIKDGFVGVFEDLASFVASPIQTAKQNGYQMFGNMSLEKGIILYAKTNPLVETSIHMNEVAETVYYDITEGNGYSTGQEIGRTTAEVGVAFVTIRLGSLFSKSGSLSSTSRAVTNASKGVYLGEKFFKSATSLQGSQGLTNVGRALQKHAGRQGSVFQDIKFSHKTANQDALKVLDDIIKSPNKIIEPAENGGTLIFDEATGRGFGVSRQGEFNGFRELPLNN